MPFYEKQVNAEGVEEFVLVEDNAIKLPDTHPLVLKNKELLAQAKAAKKVTPPVDPVGDDDSEDEETVVTTPVAKPAAKPTAKPRQPAPTQEEIDAENLRQANLAADVLEQRILARQTESKTRADAVTAIMKESGLPESLRPVIDAIPDLGAAKTHAQTLAKAGLRFDETPMGENGARVDLASVLALADAGLQLGDSDPTKKK